jgi:DNA-binding transcriptional LysR family regulator
MRRAADVLEVSHPTVRRRLENLEKGLGLRLFDRRQDGLHVTPEAEELVEMAEGIEGSILSLERRAMDADTELRGPIRVTAVDMLISDLLMPELVAFSNRWPQIDLQIQASYDLADLSRREADIAIRAMPPGKSPQEDLIGKLAVKSNKAIYGSPHQWIGWWGAERDKSWVKDTPFPDLPIKGAMNNPILQRAACMAGLGLTMLPCFMCDGLVERRSEPQPGSDIWVLYHPDLRRSPRLRIFRDEMIGALKRMEPRLLGHGSS